MSQTYSGKAKRIYRPKSPTAYNEEYLMRKAQRGLQEATEPLQKLQLMFLARGFTGFLCFSQPLRKMLITGKATMSLEEFSGAVGVSGFELNKDEYGQLFAMFDTEGSGFVGIQEFIRNIRPSIPEVRRKIVADAFNKADRAGAGIVAFHDIRKVYDVTRHTLYTTGDQSARELFSNYIRSFELYAVEVGQVTREEFEDYYAAVSSSMDSDKEFNLLLRTAFKL